MRLAIPDENRTVGIHEYAVRSIHRAMQRIAVRTVAFLAGAGDQRDGAGGRIDHPHGVTFGVREPGIARGIERDPLRATELREFRRSAITAETLLTGSCHVVNYAGLQIEFENLISLARREPEISLAIEIEGPRS